MKLLAQINFADMPGLPDFPDTGILQFYISVSDDVYGLNFDDGCAQTGFCVKYFEHVTAEEAGLMDDFLSFMLKRSTIFRFNQKR